MNDEPGRQGDASDPSLHARLYQQAARLAKLGAWECELATERLTWTETVCEIFDLPLGTPLKRATIVDLYTDESRRDMELMRAEAIRTGESRTLDVRIRTWRGELRWMRLWIDVAREHGSPVRVFGAKLNVTSEIETWERLRRMAERDPLTGLANRAVFDARYREAVGDTLHHGFVAALVLIDLDHFKPINDGLGHAAGDECLRQVAMRLQRLFKDAMLVARVGGDEFAVMLRGPLPAAAIREKLRRASDILRRPVAWNGRRIEVGASIGAAILGRPHVRKASQLFAEADEALYAAKAAGRQTVRIFGDDPVQGSVRVERIAS